MKKILSIAAMLTVAFCAVAQPQGGRPQGGPQQQGEKLNREKVNPAQMKADRMKQELSLTDKQYKKVLKVYKQEENSMHPQNDGGMQGGPGMGGPGGMPGGMGGPGMGPGGMQGGPGMGGPGMGGPGMGPGNGQRPQGPPPGMQQLSDEEMEKILSKKEKSLRKILTPEQFDTWSRKHPEEFRLEMPDWNNGGI